MLPRMISTTGRRLGLGLLGAAVALFVMPASGALAAHKSGQSCPHFGSCQGQKGAKGAKGVTGATGPTGPQGPTGPTGSSGGGSGGGSGATGATGPPGATGATGPEGKMGREGETGPKGETVTGPTGPSGGGGGGSGATGATGPTGEKGTNGTNGTNGATGATGPSGGPPGPTGPTGSGGGGGGGSGETGATGATGATGTTGTEGKKGEIGPTGPTGSGGTGSAGTTGALCSAAPKAGAGAHLAANEQMQGDWATSMYVPAGGTQQQVDAAISFPCEMGEEPKAEYLTEKKVVEGGVAKQCEGTGIKPEAEKGFLCVYDSSGISNIGTREVEWTEAEFVGLADPIGDLCCSTPNTPAGLLNAKAIGAFVVYRTKGFGEDGSGNPLTTPLPAAAKLSAAGSWAAREKT